MTDNIKTVIALGMFDGVHMGHRRLIQRAAALAQTNGLEAMVYTFANHPMGVFSQAPPLLMTLEERVSAIHALGVERVETPAFTRELAALSPEAFVEILLDRYHMGLAVAGFNYTFGKLGAGTVETLSKLGERFGFLVETVPAVHCHGRAVSSTGIRQCLGEGDASFAMELLGAPYAISGIIAHNRHIGTGLGYPTANLLPAGGKLLPRFGVYATIAEVSGEKYPAVTNVGNNPTVQGREITIETHILHEMGDLYGKPLCVQFLAWIRPEMQFTDQSALARQIAKDVNTAGKCFQSLENQALLDKNVFANADKV